MNQLVRTCRCHWLGRENLHWGRGTEREAFVPPETPPRYAPDTPVEGRHMRLEIHLEPTRQRAWGTTTHELQVRAAEVRELHLDAVALDIEAVRLGGRPAAFEYSGEQLTVLLPRPASRGRRITVAIDHAVERPRAGLYFTQPDRDYPRRFATAWSQGQDEDSRFYFPCLDHPNFKQTSEALIYVPRGQFALSNGELVAHRPGATRREDLWHYRFDLPYSTYLFSVVAGEFAAHREQAGETEVRWYVQPGREREGRNAFGATGKILRFLAEYTGHPYPYPQYTQIAVPDFVFGGMENFTVTTQTDLTLHDDRAHLDFSSDDLVAHEAAHTWFGNLVTARSWAHAWLHESFATYMETLYRRETLGQDEYDYVLLQDAEAYFREDGSYRRALVTHRYQFPIDLFDAHLYPGGGVRLRNLHALLGEAAFREVLALFLDRHRLGLVETVDFARVVEQVTGVNHDWWFAQWIHGAGYPALEVRHSWDSERKLVEVRVKQTQPMGTQRDTAQEPEGDRTDLPRRWFRLPLTVAFRHGQRESRFPLLVDGEETRIAYALPARPEQVLLDPDYECPPLKATCEKPLEMWLHELERAPRPVARIRAAEALAEKPSTRAVRVLGERLLAEGFWGVQERIARALGTLGGEAAREALLAALEVPHPKARRAVVEALGQFRDDPAVGRALKRKASRGDASYRVEAEVARSLGRCRATGALAVLRRQLRKPSHLEGIRAAAFEALAELGDPAAFEDVLAGARYGAPAESRPGAIMALARLGRDHPALRRPAREALEAILRLADNPAGTFRGKLAALRALELLGDLEALPALQAMASAEADGRIVRLAERTAERLRKQAEKPAELHSLRDELRRTVKEQKRLRDQVESLTPPAQPQRRAQSRARGSTTKSSPRSRKR